VSRLALPSRCRMETLIRFRLLATHMGKEPIYDGSNFEEFKKSTLAFALWKWESRDFIKEPLQVLSYGGGTQSTAMLCLIKENKLSRPDIVIHADTGSELPETVEFLEVARKMCSDMNLPFVIVSSHRGTLHDDYMSKKTLPIIGVRSCTMNFKIQPQRRFVREIVGNRRGRVLATSWLGITTDEEGRSLVKNKDSPNHGKRQTEGDVKWMNLSYPLLDEIPLTRDEAIAINEKHNLQVGKSGCFCCPYAGSRHWLNLRENEPKLFAICIEMESLKQEEQVRKGRKGGRGLFRDRPLTQLDTYNFQEDSNCDSGAGCFL